MDSAIEKWRQAGRLFLWRYGKRAVNKHGWQIAADVPGSANLAELIGLIGAAQHPVRRTLIITPPSLAMTQIPNASRAVAGVWSPKHLKISFDQRLAGDLWSIDEMGEQVIMTFGAAWLADLSQAAVDMGRREGDYSIGPNGSEQGLWIWWPDP
jgi:hypothetical protein